MNRARSSTEPRGSTEPRQSAEPDDGKPKARPSGIGGKVGKTKNLATCSTEASDSVVQQPLRRRSQDDGQAARDSFDDDVLWEGEFDDAAGLFDDDDEVSSAHKQRARLTLSRRASMFGLRSHMDILYSVLAEEPCMDFQPIQNIRDSFGDEGISLNPESNLLDRAITASLEANATNHRIRVRQTPPASGTESTEGTLVDRDENLELDQLWLGSRTGSVSDQGASEGTSWPSMGNLSGVVADAPLVRGGLGGRRRIGAITSHASGAGVSSDGRNVRRLGQLSQSTREQGYATTQETGKSSPCSNDPAVVANPRSLLAFCRDRGSATSSPSARL